MSKETPPNNSQAKKTMDEFKHVKDMYQEIKDEEAARRANLTREELAAEDSDNEAKYKEAKAWGETQQGKNVLGEDLPQAQKDLEDIARRIDKAREDSN